MLQKMNKFIADNGIWIFLCAVTYRLVFYIIDLVSAFDIGAGYGVRRMFDSLLGIVLEMIILVVILEISRKVASDYAPGQPVQNRPYNAPTPAPQQPIQQAQPVQPVQQAQPVQPVQQAQPVGGAAWFCSNCGAQNNDGMAFCAKCGKPK